MAEKKRSLARDMVRALVASLPLPVVLAVSGAARVGSPFRGFLFGLVTMLVLWPIVIADTLARHDRAPFAPFLPHHGERRERIPLLIVVIVMSTTVGFVVAAILA